MISRVGGVDIGGVVVRRVGVWRVGVWRDLEPPHLLALLGTRGFRPFLVIVASHPRHVAPYRFKHISTNY